MNILLTNDDGIRAPGLKALADAFSAAGHEVYICAPNRERSAVSHGGTFDRALRAEPVDYPGAKAAWACDGTPSDCASLGVFLVRRQAKLDLAISGINRGMNAGGACVYSGTVGAAMEAAMAGVQALAVSLYFDPHGTVGEDYAAAARVALRVAEWVPAHPLPRGVLYNLNVPALPYEQLKGIAPATLAPVFLNDPVFTQADDGGWLYGNVDFPPMDDPKWDVGLCDRGWCSLTKLTWDFRLNAPDDEMNEIKL